MPIVSNKYRGTAQYILLYRELVTAALYRGTISYMDVARIIGITQTGHHMASEVGHILGEVSEDESNAGRPMLSALAVSSTGQPGAGFYSLARDLELLQSDAEEEKLRFWNQQRAAVYSKWHAAANP